ncbi:serine O-acetyltransferase EpsC [Labilibaculum antarcticum]|uniref:Serine O-acetyltransferase n=1 Tax=Labilibaculum antarcticum TaxID=1717717 RepID=A0A1Y1CQU2_9BACT|nr:serine O-acetyltransferase EpsC [Labilibaculum antarcticum]BAX82312.1 serine O-acetyltransferase [Labilibaculum antarcticum]
MSYLSKVMEELQASRKNSEFDMPSRDLAQQFVEEAMNSLFPINARRSNSSCEQEALLYQLESILKLLLLPVKNELEAPLEKITHDFMKTLPKVYRDLLLDAEAIQKFDPAASSLGEVIIAYPGFFAILVYRISNILYHLNVPLIPRLMSEYAHTKTGIDIHPGATIGESFFIDHGTGVVIGESAIIKNNVKIYQGVTLGALQVKKSMAKKKRHPTVEDNVIIYSNTTILGGETVIGRNSIIGGNVWLTSSVESNSIVYHKHETKVRTKLDESKIINFQI